MSLNNKVYAVNKFGVGSIQQDLTDIWVGATGGGDQIIKQPKPSINGETLYVSSSSVNDTDQGAGAWTIIINGLDAQLLPQEETIVLQGQTQVSTTKVYSRICRAFVVTASSDSGSIGKIYIGTQGAVSGVPAVFYALITTESLTGDDFSTNQTQQACFTVPRGYKAKIEAITCGVERTGADVIFFIRTKDALEPNSVWRVRENLYAGAAGKADRTYAVDAEFGEGTDILISASSSINDTEGSASFDLLLIRVEDVAAQMNGSLTVSESTTNSFKVAWPDVKNKLFNDGFKIVVSNNATDWGKEFSVDWGVTEFTVSKLTEGFEYTVQVSSTFGNATSAPLNTVVDLTQGE